MRIDRVAHRVRLIIILPPSWGWGPQGVMARVVPSLPAWWTGLCDRSSNQ
jgi:hypothetical protein